MATSQQFLVCSNSSAANFISWASALSNWLRTCGWTNTADTGQLNGAGGNNWAGVSTVPGSGAFYYEIFQPGDGLTAFYLKLEYGNFTAQTNSPTIAVTLGSATDGAGNLTGNVLTRQMLMQSNTSSPSAATPYECNFSGDSGKVAVMLWRNAAASSPQFFAIQRSLNASGATTSGYVTYWGGGGNGASAGNGTQQSLHFTNGPGPLMAGGSVQNTWFACSLNASQSLAFAGKIPIWNPLPVVGILDYPPTIVGLASASDVAEAVLFTVVNQYGQTKTYLPSKVTPFSRVLTGSSLVALCMEFD